jgi:hypothetical protein
MRNIRFDWRWIGLIVIVALIANVQVIPWPFLALALAGGGGYLLFIGWRVWNTGTPRAGPPRSAKRVKYWRGQRIELDDPPPHRRSQMPALRAIGPALIYLLMGGALVLGSISLLVDRISG